MYQLAIVPPYPEPVYQKTCLRGEERQVVAFALSTLLTIALCVAVFAYGARRPVGTPLTWGEAMLAATLVYLILFLAYGVVPHQWLTWADNELEWRPDKVWLGPGDVLADLPFDLHYQILRDIIAATIYIVFLGAQIALWKAWQDRGRQRPREIETSQYGRPLVKRT
jgi:Na+-driven multidrug efflux pump